MPDLWPVHPALPLLLGGVLMAFVGPTLRKLLLVVLPVLGLANLLAWDLGATQTATFISFELEVLAIDKLSRLFGVLFHLAALVGGIYSLHSNDKLQQATGAAYAGSAVAAVFAGDLLTLFVAWELLAVTSVFQVWVARTPESARAGARYLLLHVISGVLLLAGAAVAYHDTGSLAIRPLELEGWSATLLFLAFGIKCAFPLVHTWLVDAYPAASPVGTVFLCCFTTKTAVYAFARMFAGTEELIWIGAIMAMFPIFYAVIENDLRRVLGYSMINQIGFMVVGVGLGAGMGVNGAVAHAFNDVFFKGLLFMTMGAVLYRTGRMNGSDLGGLYKTMPWTCAFCMVGAASISAFPLFSGFVSKSLILQEAANQGYLWVWLALLFAAAGVFHHAGIKIPFFAFFAHDSGLRVKEAPRNMLVAMGMAAAVCIGVGCMPHLLYDHLPHEMNFEPYTAAHVVTQLQILFFSALAFVTLMLTKIYPPELRSVNLDVDWVSRKLFPAAWERIAVPATNAVRRGAFAVADLMVLRGARRLTARTDQPLPQGALVLVFTAMLALYLIAALFRFGASK